jgi:tetratricopeptide (TPR) repeat protein
MRFEALGRYDDASQLYDKLVTFDPTNAGYRKRQIAILKAQGHRIDAIKELNEYLKTFINDTEAWLEQCRNYLAECDYARAAHCMEELLLAQPHNSLYLQRYAEIKYAQGGFENVDTAKQYFVQSARTDTTNAMRSLYGILLCCQALVQHKSSTGGAPKRKDAIVVAQWAADRILERYAVDGIEAKNPNVADQRKCVKQMMKAITSTSST